MSTLDQLRAAYASSGSLESSYGSSSGSTSLDSACGLVAPPPPAAKQQQQVINPPGGPPAAQLGAFAPPLSNPRGAVLRPVGPSAPKLPLIPRSGSAQGPLHVGPTPVGGLMLPLAAGYAGPMGAAAAADEEDQPAILVGLRVGDFGGRVGLLPGLRPKLMDAFAMPNELTERKRRAPREDLTGYTAEEKVRRRNERARIYTNQARARQEEQQRELEEHLKEYRHYELVVELAPHMGLLVLRADLHAVVLYASRPLERLLGLRHEEVLGQALWAFMHPADQARVAAAMGDLILTLVPPKRALRCRLIRRPAPAAAGPSQQHQHLQQHMPPPPMPPKRKRGLSSSSSGGGSGGAADGLVTVTEGGVEYVWASLNMRNGTQGLVVSVWPEAQW